MATYAELLAAAQNESLFQKVRVACVIAAAKVMAEAGGTANHAKRLVWAAKVFSAPDDTARAMMQVAVAKAQVDLPTVTLAQITGATDAVVQSSVDAAVDLFAGV